MSAQQPRLELVRLGEVLPLGGRMIGWEDLRALVQGMFGHRLEELHEWPYFEAPDQPPTRDTDQLTHVHEQFYRLWWRMRPTYHLLAAALAARFVGEPCYIQRVPSFRVHFPRSRAVGEPHTDFQYGHQFGEVSFWLPLTEARYSATMWVGQYAQGWDVGAQREFADTLDAEGIDAAMETLPAPVPMWPVNASPGDLLVWDSTTRVHANLINVEGLTEMLELDLWGEVRQITAEEGAALVDTAWPGHERGGALKVRRQWWAGSGTTRVSLDFRALPKRLLEPDTLRYSVNTQTPMTLGTKEKPGYWTDPDAPL